MASNSACIAESETGDDSTIAGSQQAVMVLPKSTAIQPLPIGQPGHQSSQKSSDQGKQELQLSPGTPRSTNRDIHGLKASDAISSPPPTVDLPAPSSPLQSQLNHSINKAGLCVICSCINPQHGDPIVGCTAPTKMSKCFGSDLGFSVMEVPSDSLSRAKMNQLLRDLGRVKMPTPAREEPFRFFFYFFGHGNSTEICLTDGNFERSKIITEIQKIDKNLCKIVLFDSCRLASKHNNSQLEEKGQYPKSINTLVIHANEYKSEAFYSTSDNFPEMKGCGLVTYYFTKLASKLNQPLSAVLTEVRQAVDNFTQENTDANYNQMLVFEDRLMQNVNLLAESKGQERVKPVIVRVEVSHYVTTVQWVFRINVDKRIQKFRVKCRDDMHEEVDIKFNMKLKNVAEFKNDPLLPNAMYYVRVLAVYEDGFESESEEFSFKLCDRHDTTYLPSRSTVQLTGVVLGRGTYGDVLEVRYKEKVYAAKKYRFCSSDSASIKAFTQEHEILTKICHHPNVVPYYCIGQLETDKSLVLVMERMDKNLAVYLEQGQIALPVKFKLLYNIGNGLDHLHQQKPPIIHRDLTATNVLINLDGVAKISDFGNSRIIDSSGTTKPLTSKPGTIDYMPPEALETEYDYTLDIFSYGHLAIYILLNKPPQLRPATYVSNHRVFARTEVERREVSIKEVETILKSDENPFYCILIQCLDNEKEKRPKCKDILDCITTNKLTDSE